MSKINTGGAAFPSARMSSDGERIVYENEGLSVRDYFAAKAMQAAIPDVIEVGSIDDTLKGLAVGSYKVADAMIKARGEQ